MAFDEKTTDRVPVGVTAPEKPLGLLASYRTARRNVLELIPAAAYRTPILRGEGRARWIMLMDPTALQHVLLTREADYPKSAILLRLITPRQGTNLIISTGEDWHRQRAAVAPAFTPRALATTSAAITDVAASLAQDLDSAAGETVDVFPKLVDATCDVICDVALSGRDSVDRDALTDAVNTYVATVGRISILDILGVPNWVPRPHSVTDRSRRRMDDMADEIIAQRRARGPSDPPDMLDLLIGSDHALDRLEIRNNLMGFLFAGHETTALSLTWALYLLAFDPAVQERAQAEVDGVLGGRAATWEDLANLGYVRQVSEEALRLYPPAGFLTRTAARDDVIAGHAVRKGDTVILPIYAMHRTEGLWENPHAFAPDRIAPEDLHWGRDGDGRGADHVGHALVALFLCLARGVHP